MLMEAIVAVMNGQCLSWEVRRRRDGGSAGALSQCEMVNCLFSWDDISWRDTVCVHCCKSLMGKLHCVETN